MKFPGIQFISLLLVATAFAGCSPHEFVLNKIGKFPTYPSASGIEYHDGRYYVIGDDATHLLVLDSSMNISDSLLVYPFAGNRIPKGIKPDYESISVLNVHDSSSLLLIGSGSYAQTRSTARVLNLTSRISTEVRLDTFYKRLLARGLDEINIEGSCSIPGGMLLSNRGNKSVPKNYLVFTSTDFWEKQRDAPITLMRIGGADDTSSFQGVSGLAYSRKSDKLIVTVSTENTRSAYEDGEIGKSYLWIIDNFSSKRKWTSINPTRIIDLEEVSKKFHGQKIESVCIVKETKNYLELTLAADNDNGSSCLFSVELLKNGK